jgi:death on curing protein
MSNEGPAFLDIEQIEALHRISLELHGGQVGLRDRAALEGAALQPRNVWLYGQGDLFDVAAAYAFQFIPVSSFRRREQAHGNGRGFGLS